MIKFFVFVSLFSFQVSAASFDQLQTTSSEAINKLQQSFEHFSQVYEKVNGHCTKNSALAFSKSSDNQRLITVARNALKFINTDYDRPSDIALNYYGPLSEVSDSFNVALKQLSGGRNFNYALRVFNENNDQASAKKLYAAKDKLQAALSELSVKERVLVYAGEAKQAFGAFQFVIILDPNSFEVSVFQAGWCE